MAHQKFEKQLTVTDLDRLVVPREMCVIMASEMDELIRSHARRERIPPIEVRALDNKGDVHVFELTGRTACNNLKPTFMANGWRKFISGAGARAGDIFYFWAEVNEMMRTDYRIALLTSHLRPHPEKLSSLTSPAPEDLETKDELMSWGAKGGLGLSS